MVDQVYAVEREILPDPSASCSGPSVGSTAQIPPLQFGAQVEYYITAFDSAALKSVNNNSGSYFSYTVSSPWFTNLWIYMVLALAVALGIFAIFYTKRRQKTANSQTPSA